MSYDLWLIPADRCPTPEAAYAHGSATLDTDTSNDPHAQRLADAVSTASERSGEDGFLSVAPIDAEGDCVFVPSPYSSIQEARDAVVPLAFAAGFAVYDPQNGLLLDPRRAIPARMTTHRDGTFDVLSPESVDFFVSRMAVDDFVIVETALNTYMQSRRDADDVFALEYRAGSADRHFATEVPTAAHVASAMHGWLTGNDSPYRDHAWKRLDLTP
ncbi:hypothetical protein nbrc107696_02290 [Gordonia spumicola]|uniref:Uncharacterized protein n=1 Tax=Gordonia spumicola TaxID=589161 RepID=A0A7I9V3M3_9ACTN|nr:hypothetical protein [Gordonia spumicola]GED99782.1 hypothetical protein nbrc107696_02290 [Gordonia spumicola]